MAKIGLVLSGGMAKGAYQIGALRAINEFVAPKDIESISAASIGGINAYAYANNLLPMVEELWRKISSDKNYRWVAQTMKTEFVRKIATELYAETPLGKPLFVPLYEPNRCTLIYQDLSKVEPEKMVPYLSAVISMPVYTTGVKIDGHNYYDGAMIDNIPVHPLVERDLDYILCLYFDDYNYVFENKEFGKKVVKLAFSDDAIVSNSIVLSKERTEFMMSTGYTKTRALLEDLFVNGVDDVEYILSKVERYDALHKDQPVRITGDVMVGNLNKVAKFFTRRQKQ